MRDTTGPIIALGGRVNDADVARASFLEQLMRGQLRRLQVAAWLTRAAEIAVPGSEVLWDVRGLGWCSAVLRIGASLAYISLGDGLVTARVAYRHDSELADVLAQLRVAVP